MRFGIGELITGRFSQVMTARIVEGLRRMHAQTNPWMQRRLSGRRMTVSRTFGFWIGSVEWDFRSSRICSVFENHCCRAVDARLGDCEDNPAKLGARDTCA